MKTIDNIIYAEPHMTLVNKVTGYKEGKRTTVHKVYYTLEGKKSLEPIMAGEEYYNEVIDYAEIAQETRAQIAELKEQLASTDYQCLKWCEGYLSDEEYEPIKEERQAMRDKINELEDSLK